MAMVRMTRRGHAAHFNVCSHLGYFSSKLIYIIARSDLIDLRDHKGNIAMRWLYAACPSHNARDVLGMPAAFV